MAINQGQMSLNQTISNILRHWVFKLSELEDYEVLSNKLDLSFCKYFLLS